MKRIRRALGLTQSQLAILVGGKGARVSDYESDRRNIPAKHILVIESFAEISRLGGNSEQVSKRARGSIQCPIPAFFSPIASRVDLAILRVFKHTGLFP